MRPFLDDQAFRKELQTLAGRIDRPVESLRLQANDDLEEMRGDRSDFAVRVFAWLSRYLCRRGYDPDYYHDVAELERVRKLASNQSVVYLVTHKTYLDFFVLFDFFYRNGIAPPYIFGGVNMAFSGFGGLARRAGGIFIRRSFADDLVYKAVLRRYIQHLIGEGCSFMWAIEGTRSRTGKLVLPKLGLLKYVSDASLPLGDDAVAYVPVSVSYDRIPDVIDLAAQEVGAIKRPESLGWFAGYIRRLSEHFGHVYVRFGEALAFSDTPDAPDLTASQKLGDPHYVEIQKLAFEVCYRINEVTPATATSLVLMSLLCRTTETAEQIRNDVAALQRYLRVRQSSSIFHRPSGPIDESADSALESLIAHGLVERDDDTDSCGIVRGRYLEALYYSNMAVHHFVIAAFTELGLLNMTLGAEESGEPAFRNEVMRLRDLFKFEFFFSRRDRFFDQIIDELLYLDAPMDALRSHDRAAAEALLRRQPLLVSYGVLSPFINAYLVVATGLERLGNAPVGDRDAFIAGCQARGRQLIADDDSHHPGIVSRALLTNGYSLAANRGLLENGSGIAEERQQFVDEIRTIALQLDEIRSMAR